MPTNKEYNKMYYLTHKEKFAKQEWFCTVCNRELQGNKLQHIKTKYHIKKLISI